uniref:Putative secreted peptide n=1 Tax=Anopheles braziliensis TaxID=58242 RepID=A0A2M3ZTF0_9DIPT
MHFVLSLSISFVFPSLYNYARCVQYMLNVTESIGVFRRYLIQIAHLNYDFFCLISSSKDTPIGSTR